MCLQSHQNVQKLHLLFGVIVNDLNLAQKARHSVWSSLHLSWELWETTGRFRKEVSQTRGSLFPGDTACSTVGWKVELVSDEPDHLTEVISKLSVEGAAWLHLLLIVKGKRKEVAVIHLESEGCSSPRSPEEARKQPPWEPSESTALPASWVWTPRTRR